MASLRRIPGSRYWIACITRADGTRTNISTKTTDRSLAKKVAERYQEVEDKARAGTLVTAQVKKVFNEVLERTGEEQLSTETVENFLREWLKSKTNPGTAERYKHTVSLFLASLGKKKDALLTSVGHKDVVTFIESRRESLAAPKTILVDVKTLNTAFNLARKLGHIQTNPVEKALALHPIETVSSEKDCFRQDQVAALVAAAEGDWRTATLLGFYTGARLGDCANMTWANINFEDGVIDYVPQKTRKKKKRVVVPMHSELRSHLQALRESVHALQLCPSLAGRDTGGKSGLSEAFKKLMQRAGVDGQLVAGKGKRMFSKLSFHSLRHSFNSALANNGVDQETRMQLTGHSSIDINRGYTHIGLPKLKEAIAKLSPLTNIETSVPKPNGACSPGPTEDEPALDSEAAA